MQMDEIDGNAHLSRENKQHKRTEMADRALAEFEASKTLVGARQAVRSDGSPAMLKALQHAEVGWERAMNKIAERAGMSKSTGIRR